VSNGIEVYTAVLRRWIDVNFLDGDATPDEKMRRLTIEAIKVISIDAQMPGIAENDEEQMPVNEEEQMPANQEQMPAEQMPANEEQMPANEEPMES
jgi:hypothetical protein